ncbi:molecular chaperone DnaK [Spirochaetia bacterium]|nr:molecular chaperone DnaK [Spirochaetia bacterium]
MVVGIDLGTTFSAVARINPQTGLPEIIPNSEGSKITPSIIQFAPGGLVFGSEAKDAFEVGEDNCITTFKRNMGMGKEYCTIDGKEYTAEELSALLLTHLKEDAEQVSGEKIEEAVITVPAYFYSKEREATIKSARRAGLKVRKIINEPTAAAIAYGLNHWRTNAKILVYDLGGGTCDVTLTAMKNESELNTLGTFGDHYLGGRDWDARLGDLLLKKIEAETGINPGEDRETKIIVTRLAENCKKQLSQKSPVKVPVSLPGFGQCTVEVTREEFDSLTADLIERTGILCKTVLDEVGFTWPDVTDILLVGGSTRMPQVSAYLQRISGKKPIAHVNPDEAVALGAAVQTQLKDPTYNTLAVVPKDAKKNKGPDNKLSVVSERRITQVGILTVNEVTTHAMGIIAVNEAGTEYINETIIPANYPIPVKSARAFNFYTRSNSDNELDIYVLQGDKKPLECAIPYKYVVTGIRHVKGGKTLIRIQYSYDQNAVIHVQARQEQDTKDLPIRIEPVPEDMSKYGRPIETEVFVPETLSILLAVDVSGSMSGDPLSDAQNAMCAFVDDIDISSAEIGIIAVSDRVELVYPLTDNAEKCKKAIRGITCGQTGYGNDTHPFKLIRKELGNRKGRRFAVILADGVWSNQDVAIRAAKECHKENIEIAAIGFGGADEDFLRNISSSDANALKVSQSELTKTFGSIAQSMGSGGGGNNARDRGSSGTETWEEEE